MTSTIDPLTFYSNYHGHTTEDLLTLYNSFRDSDKDIIFLAGDSSLDNKYWVPHQSIEAFNGYEQVLNPPIFARQDISFWINKLCVDQNKKLVCINGAVEESTLENRNTRQDVFIESDIRTRGILIVSVGANDIALHPSFWTILHLITYWCLHGNYTLESLELRILCEFI